MRYCLTEIKRTPEVENTQSQSALAGLLPRAVRHREVLPAVQLPERAGWEQVHAKRRAARVKHLSPSAARGGAEHYRKHPATLYELSKKPYSAKTKLKIASEYAGISTPQKQYTTL